METKDAHKLSKKEVVLELLQTYEKRASPGTIVLGVWRDLRHFDEWCLLRVDPHDNIRIVIVPSRTFTMIPVENKAAKILGGIVFSQTADYLDATIQYCIAVTPTKPLET